MASGTGPHEDHLRTREHLRASDSDRQRVADRLRQALDEGRLTLLEYDERLGAAYGSLTYGELAKVTSDLPDAAPGSSILPAEGSGSAGSGSAGSGSEGSGTAGTASPVPAGGAEPPGRTRAYLIQQGRGWLGGAVITNGIWAATSGFDWHSYWPGIVLPIWAVAILAGAIKGDQHKDPDQRDRDRGHLGRGPHRTD
ncbi:MAG: hypothetical protein QOD04_2272 [Pseudonocardiales bacterium]|nr:hypothetical protein [Pseudonocardiales bacterium]